MQSITATHRQIISDFNSIKQAINDQGVTVTDEPTSEYAQKILDIQANPTLITKNITVNGTYDASDDSADGYSEVVVNVPTPAPNLQDKTVTQNGTVTADSGYDGLGTVTVNIEPNLKKSKTITENSKTYKASDEGYDGYKKVSVYIPTGTKTITENGEYLSSSDSLDGYYSVTVNVPTGEIDYSMTKYTEKIVTPEFIKDLKIALYFSGAAASNGQTINFDFMTFGENCRLDLEGLQRSDYIAAKQAGKIAFGNFYSSSSRGIFGQWTNFSVDHIYGLNNDAVLLFDANALKNMFNQTTFKNNSIDLAWIEHSASADLSNMFAQCTDLETVLNLDLQDVQTATNIFYGCTNLETLTAKSSTYLGSQYVGLNIDLSAAANLDIMGYINSLATSPVAWEGGYSTITVHSSVYATLTSADLATIANKHYKVVSA